MIKLIQTIYEILLMDPLGAMFILGMAVGVGMCKICDAVYELLWHGRKKK